MRTLTWSTIIVVLCASASSSSLTGRRSLVSPLSDRLIQVNFFVDRKDHLADDYLEVTVVADQYRKHRVEVASGQGTAEVAVPSGPVDLIVCGRVNCPLKETEMACGKMELPDQIAVDQIHEITFLTAQACHDAPPSLAAKTW